MRLHRRTAFCTLSPDETVAWVQELTSQLALKTQELKATVALTSQELARRACTEATDGSRRAAPGSPSLPTLATSPSSSSLRAAKGVYSELQAVARLVTAPSMRSPVAAAASPSRSFRGV